MSMLLHYTLMEIEAREKAKQAELEEQKKAEEEQEASKKAPSKKKK